MKYCTSCGAQITDEDNFCPYCGAKISSINEEFECPQCNRIIKSYQKYCPVCGYENPHYNSTATYSNPKQENIFEDDLPPVKPLEAYKLYFKNTFKYSGTAQRGEYWWPVLFNIIIHFILSIIEAFVPALTYEVQVEYMILGTVTYTYGILTGIFGIICFLPSLSCIIRRLRDAGHSPLALLYILIPIAGPIILIALLAKPTAGTY